MRASRHANGSGRRSGRAAQPRARRAAVPPPPAPLDPRPRRVLRPLRGQGASRRRYLRLPRRTLRVILAGHQRLYLISNNAPKLYFSNVVAVGVTGEGSCLEDLTWVKFET